MKRKFKRIVNCVICNKIIKLKIAECRLGFWDSDDGIFYNRKWFCNSCWNIIIKNVFKDLKIKW